MKQDTKMAKQESAGYVSLFAESVDGDIIESHRITYDQYYNGGIPVVDANDYRAKLQIRKLRGEIYRSSGALQQQFENHYSEDGRFSSGRTVHDDGTVVED
jgi:hypothetical protein